VWIAWWVRWHEAAALTPLWTLSATEALLPMAVIAAIAAGAIAMARRGWLANPSDLHGSARWGTTRDLRAARLIDARRNPLRKLAARMRIIGSIAQRAGVYLGTWRHAFIRDCGLAHVLVFAPTRSGKGVAGARKRMGQICLRFAPASADGDGA